MIMICQWCGGRDARGTCPLSIACPTCRAGPGTACLRPSGHGCDTHTDRFRTTEVRDGAECPGLLRFRHGCGLCSGLPEDHVRQEAVINGLTAADYDPGHPWYYFLGGVPPAVEGIALSDNLPEPEIPQRDRRHQITRAIVEAESALGSSIARYEDIVARGDEAISEWDRHYDSPGRCRGLHVALALTHNHVCYHKTQLAMLRELLAREPKELSPARMAEIRNLLTLGLFTPGQVARKFKLDPAIVARIGENA